MRQLVVNENLRQQMLLLVSQAKESSDWELQKLDVILEFYDSNRKPLSSRQRDGMEKNYPYYGATTIVDYVENYIFDGTYILVSEDGANVVDAQGHPLVQYTHGKFWLNNHAHIVKGKNGCSEALIFALLASTNMNSIVTGAAQPKINQANLRGYETLIPTKSQAEKLSEILNPMLSLIIANDISNQRLSQLRDSMLSRLMSGELDVSEIDL